MRRLLWLVVLCGCDDGGSMDPAPPSDAAPTLDATRADGSPDAAPRDAALDQVLLDATPDAAVDAGPDQAAMDQAVPDQAVPSVPARAPLITEIVASNRTGLTDADGDRPDWIELYNPHPVALEASRFALSDGGAPWVLPAGELPPFSHRVVFASGKDRRGPAWHADFRVAAEGETIHLLTADGVALQTIETPALGPDQAYGLPAITVRAPDAPVRTAPPAADERWTAPDADDSDWAATPQGLGVRAAAAPSPLAHLAEHLRADWRFEQDADGRIVDGSGLHPGVLSAGAAVVETARSGPALGGEAGWMAATDPEGFDFDAAFTWSLWFRGVDGSGALISRNPAGTAWNQGSKALFVRNGTLQWDSGWVGNPRTGVRVTDDRWRHVAVTWRPDDDRFRIYIDGEIALERVFDVDRFPEDGQHLGGQARSGLFIGQAHFSGGLPSLDKYTGRIDDVSIWATELAPADVALLAAGARPGPGDPYGDRLVTALPAGTAAPRIRLALPPDLGRAPHLGIEIDPGARWWVDGVARAALAGHLDGPTWRGLPGDARTLAFALDAADGWFFRARIATLDPTPAPLAAPTPGDFNAAAVAPAVAFSRGDGIFVEPFDLVLAAPAGTIHYTTDGSEPTAASPVYAGPLRVDATQRVHARVFAPDQAPGPIGSAAFLEATPAFVAAERPLPTIVLARFEQGAAGRAYSDALLFAFEPNAADPALSSRAAMRVRGQSSANQPKRPYRVELRDAAGADRALPLLGLPAEADWVLHAPFTDQSLIRNALVYGLGRDLRIESPRAVHCEVYVQSDGAPLDVDDHRGVYLLVESIEPGAERLELSDAGYLLKFEAGVAEPPIVAGYRSLEIDRPAPPSPEQAQWIGDHLAAFEGALDGPDFADPAAGYAPWIDEASFIDLLVINELFRDQDGYVRSAWLHLEPDGPIVMGPLWDYNLTAGTGGYFENTATEGWQWAHRYNRGEHGWFARLMADPAFAARFADRWRGLRAGLLSDARLGARIDALAAVVAPAAAANFARWDTLGRARVNGFVTPVAPTWEGQIEALRGWLVARAAWMDAQLAP